MKVTYIRFLTPGSFFPEYTDVKYTGEPVPVPKHAFAYTTLWRNEDGEGEDLMCGRWHEDPYRLTLFGTTYTLEQLKAKFGDDPEYRILISNCTHNTSKGAVQCVSGNWQPWREEMTVLPERPETVSL